MSREEDMLNKMAAHKASKVKSSQPSGSVQKSLELQIDEARELTMQSWESFHNACISKKVPSQASQKDVDNDHKAVNDLIAHASAYDSLAQGKGLALLFLSSFRETLVLRNRMNEIECKIVDVAKQLASDAMDKKETKEDEDDD